MTRTVELMLAGRTAAMATGVAKVLLLLAGLTDIRHLTAGRGMATGDGLHGLIMFLLNPVAILLQQIRLILAQELREPDHELTQSMCRRSTRALIISAPF